MVCRRGAAWKQDAEIIQNNNNCRTVKIQKRSLPATGLWNRRPLNIMNDSKFFTKKCDLQNQSGIIAQVTFR